MTYGDGWFDNEGRRTDRVLPSPADDGWSDARGAEEDWGTIELQEKVLRMLHAREGVRASG